MNRTHSFVWLPLITVVALPALAQKIDYSFGARAGLVLNRGRGDSSSISPNGAGSFRNDSSRASAGATFEIGFRNRFGIELSPTYRREGFSGFNDFTPPSPPPELPPGGAILLSQLTRQNWNTWDIPLAGKYYFANKGAKIRPFVGLGGAAIVRAEKSYFYSRLQDHLGKESRRVFELDSRRIGLGAVFNTGVAIRSGRISIVPEFRYVRDNLAPYTGQRNRAEVFLGFRF